MSIEQQIQQEKVVSVIRKANEENIVPILEALHEGGINSVEITAETPRVLHIIETAVKHKS